MILEVLVHGSQEEDLAAVSCTNYPFQRIRQYLSAYNARVSRQAFPRIEFRPEEHNLNLSSLNPDYELFYEAAEFVAKKLKRLPSLESLLPSSSRKLVWGGELYRAAPLLQLLFSYSVFFDNQTKQAVSLKYDGLVEPKYLALLLGYQCQQESLSEMVLVRSSGSEGGSVLQSTVVRAGDPEEEIKTHFVKRGVLKRRDVPENAEIEVRLEPERSCTIKKCSQIYLLETKLEELVTLVEKLHLLSLLESGFLNLIRITGDKPPQEVFRITGGKPPQKVFGSAKLSLEVLGESVLLPFRVLQRMISSLNLSPELLNFHLVELEKSQVPECIQLMESDCVSRNLRVVTGFPHKLKGHLVCPELEELDLTSFTSGFRSARESLVLLRDQRCFLDRTENLGPVRLRQLDLSDLGFWRQQGLGASNLSCRKLERLEIKEAK